MRSLNLIQPTCQRVFIGCLRGKPPRGDDPDECDNDWVLWPPWNPIHPSLSNFNFWIRSRFARCSEPSIPDHFASFADPRLHRPMLHTALPSDLARIPSHKAYMPYGFQIVQQQ